MLKKSKLHIFIFVFALVLIGGMLYESEMITSKYNTQSEKEKNDLKSKSVHVLIKSMELAIHNEEGGHKAKLISMQVRHDPNENITYLDNPILIIKQPDSNWHITAKSGTINHNKVKVKKIETINLIDDVKVSRNNIKDSNVPYINLETNLLTYTPDIELFNTNEKVKIITQESITTAVGLKFNKATQKLELLSHVKTVYNNKK